jgi:hypothetical protein
MNKSKILLMALLLSCVSNSYCGFGFALNSSNLYDIQEEENITIQEVMCCILLLSVIYNLDEILNKVT